MTRDSDPLLDELEGLLDGPLAQDILLRRADDSEAALNSLPARYRINGFVGKGAMGRVYDAWDTLLERRVAIKLLSEPDPITADLMRRERQTLAAIQHPGIVGIYDSGELGDGQPYCVMQYIEGEDPRVHADKHGRSAARVARLLLAVARAVAAAHLVGVVHRDLKPSNISVGDHDEPVVFDFGVAKFGALAELTTESSAATSVYQTTWPGSVKGTLPYMSPEQLRGDPVDARTDVYALGALAHELLTGRTPLQGADEPKTLDDWRSEVERLATEPFRVHDRRLPRGLRGIIEKCLRYDSNQRYRDAGELAADLDRYLQGLPVQAIERFRWSHASERFLTRNRWPVAVAAAVFMLIAGIIAAAFHQVNAERALADLNAVNAERHSKEAIAQRIRADNRSRELQDRLYVADLAQADRLLRGHEVARARRLLDRYLPHPGEPDLRGFEWRLLDRLCRVERRTFDLADSTFDLLEFSPNADRFALYAGAHQGLACFDSVTQQCIWRADGLAGKARRLAFDPSGKALAVALSTGAIELRDGETGKPIATLRDPFAHWSPIIDIAFAASGAWLASIDASSMLCVWDVKRGRSRFQSKARNSGKAQTLAFSSDEPAVAVGFDIGHVELFDPKKGDIPRRPTIKLARPVERICWRPKRQEFAVADLMGEIYLCTFSEVAPRLLCAMRARPARLAWTKEGHALSALAENGFAHLIDSDRATSSSHEVEPDGIATGWITPDGRIASATKPAGAKAATITLQTVRREDVSRHRTLPTWCHHLAMLDDGDTLVAVPNEGKRVLGWRRRDRSEKSIPIEHQAIITSLRADSGSGRIATCDAEGVVKVTNPATAESWRMASGLRFATCVDFVPGSEDVIVGGDVGRATRLNVRTGDRVELEHVSQPQTVFSDLTVFGRGRAAVAVGIDRSAFLWDLVSGRSRKRWPAHRSGVDRVAVDPAGKLIVTGSADQSILVWDQNGNEVARMPTPGFAVFGLAISADGRTLASALRPIQAGSQPGWIQLWRLDVFEPTIKLDAASVSDWDDVIFSRDGKTVIATGHAGPAGELFLWSTAEDPAGTTPARSDAERRP